MSPKQVTREEITDEMLKRISVNYIRHNLTNYDDICDSLGNEIGGQDAIYHYRLRIHNEISSVYPELADEAKRQNDESLSPDLLAYAEAMLQ